MRREAETHILVILLQKLVVLAEGGEKYEWHHIFKAMDPLLSLSSLTSNIYNPEKTERPEIKFSRLNQFYIWYAVVDLHPRLICP